MHARFIIVGFNVYSALDLGQIGSMRLNLSGRDCLAAYLFITKRYLNWEPACDSPEIDVTNVFERTGTSLYGVSGPRIILFTRRLKRPLVTASSI